jgi:hypothetical protein
MIANRSRRCLVLLSVLGPSLGLAHHGDAGRYRNEVVTVSGTVVEFRLVNPHSVLIIAVEDDQGNVVEWHGELGSPVSLANNWGWTRSTFQPGDKVTMTGRPLKSGAPYMTLSEGAYVLDAQGREIYRGR